MTVGMAGCWPHLPGDFERYSSDASEELEDSGEEEASEEPRELAGMRLRSQYNFEPGHGYTDCTMVFESTWVDPIDPPCVSCDLSGQFFIEELESDCEFTFDSEIIPAGVNREKQLLYLWDDSMQGSNKWYQIPEGWTDWQDLSVTMTFTSESEPPVWYTVDNEYVIWWE